MSDGPEDPDTLNAAWDDIVAHYGERAEIEPDAAASTTDARTYPAPGPTDEPDEFADAWWAQEEHFVPPTPPPAPLPAGPRGIAWIGVLGAPVAMLLLVLFRVSIPGWVGFPLFAAFVGGIAYLIATMPRGGDGNDPSSGSGDDGAVV